ncbi:hypothetical protein BC835DRAFT_1317700 [Cytidiella melzeri]|nr:hypothetical protein BC835DRAFT_1317700 [Cytidiella melzeri]
MISSSPANNKMRTLPVLLLTLFALSPASLSAPTPAGLTTAPGSFFARDADSDDPPPPSTVTAFFTPAVFLQNQYTQTPMVAAAPEPTPAPFNDVIMDTTGIDANTDIVTASTAADDADQNQEAQPSEGTANASSESTADTTVAATSDVAPTMTTPAAAEVTSLAAIPLATPTLLSTPTFGRTTSTIPTGMKPLALPSASSTEMPKSASQRTEQSRKAAVIGTLLAVGSIVALMLFAFCTRLPRLARRLVRKPTVPMSDESGDEKDEDPEKALDSVSYQDNPVKPGTELARTGLNGADLFPTLDASIPPTPSGTPTNSPQPGWDQYVQEWQGKATNQDGQFEDVTHILTDNSTFAAHESDPAIPEPEARKRQSRGAPSVAQSYATCESRYSTPSVQDIADVSLTDEQSASFHSAPSRSPSPPQSPMPTTPKAGHQQQSGSPKRPRSKTLNQDEGPSSFKKNTISSSKSFPARYSNRSSEHSGMWSVLEQESEWDIAAHYGARYSARHSASPELGIVSDTVETVEIGGRNCVLVQGFAF